MSSAEGLVRDAMLRNLPSRTPTKVAVVFIDDTALRVVGPWPWGRAQLAQLVDQVFASGAKGVAIDILFPEGREGDEPLAAALGRGPSVLAAGLDEAGHWLLPTPVLHSVAVGHVSFDLDRDGVVRRFSSTKQVGEQVFPAFSVAAARLGNAQLPVPVNRMLRPAFRTRPIPTLSAAAVLASPNQGALRDRIVFIGTSAAGIGDRFISPVSQGGSPEPGVLIEAISAEAILSKDLLQAGSPLLNALLAFALGGLGSLLLRAPRRLLSVVIPGLALAPLLADGAALQLFNLELAPLAVLFALLLAGALEGGLRSRRTRQAMGAANHRIEELESIQEALSETRKLDAEARRVVAHELKTPLTSVKGLAQLLAQFDLSPPERTRVAKMVVTETSRLAQMVDALLDLERLRLRDFDRDAQLLNASALCQERMGYLRAGTPREIQAGIDKDLHVMGDKALLERVIENLVSNACKFSPEGAPIRLALKAEASMVVLEVEDHGPGVPASERASIFGRFARGSAQGLAPGLGLGLALVAEVAAWHRGTVAVDEGVGGGSVFRVRLPQTLPPSAG